NYNGPDSFTYRASDGQTNSSPATVSITVTPVNDAPVANNQNVTTPEDTSTNLVLSGSDVEGPVTFAILSGPTSGALSLLNTNTGAVTYTPATNYNGPDSFQFTVSDGSLLATGTVSIAVTPVNDVPLATDDSYSLFKNTTLSVPVSGVLTNDTDPDGDLLTALLVTGPTHAAAFNLSTNGSFTYTPVSNYVGSDSFSYRANDGQASSAVVSANLSVVATNTAPVANGQNVTTPEDTATNLVLTASDVDGNPLTFVIVSGPTNGVLSAVNTNTGAMTYTPNTNYNGGDSFTFLVNDGLTNSTTATVSITATAINDAPVANNQSGPANGVLSLLNTNTGAVTYTPATNYNGADSFTFTVSDSSLLATGTVSIAVTPVNDVPLATDDSYSLFKNTTLSVPVSGVLTNDIDPDGDPLTAILVTFPTHAAAFNLSTNGSFTYTPVSNYVGSDSFSYRAND